MRKRLENKDLEISVERSRFREGLDMAYLTGAVCYNNTKHEQAKKRARELNLARVKISL